MKPKVQCFLQTAGRVLLYLVVLFMPVLLRAQAVININTHDAEYEFKLPFGAAIGTPKTIEVQGASALVTWDYNSKPSGLPGYTETTRGFTVKGLTIALPADPGANIANTEKVTIAGTPTETGTFSFTLVVTNSDASKTQTRDIKVTISKDLQVVLVLDRSGSMAWSLTSMTRWEALKNAVSSFVNKYQALQRSNDKLSITYFDTDVTPASACCNGLVAVAPGLQTTVANDLQANNPGGWTNLGKGIQVSQTKLSDASKGRSILVFTDGEQNQVPMVGNDGKSIGGTPLPANNTPGNIKIYTIGLYGPGVMNTMLQNLAGYTGGTYNHTETGNDLAAAFDAALASILANSSPQLVKRSTTKLTPGAGMQKLLEFPVNNRVDKLLLEFTFDKKFETNQLTRMLYQIKVLHDSANVTYSARTSYAGNYTNSMLLTFYFNNYTETPIAPQGKWEVFMSDSMMRVGQVLVTAIADDHNFHMTRTLGNQQPKVKDKYPIAMQLDWLGHAIKNADVQAVVLRPGEDLGDILAKNPFVAKLSSAQDAGSPGQQKFDQLIANDSTFRALMQSKSENAVALKHTANGKYEGTFDGLTVTGTYNLLIRVKAVDSAGGTIERFHEESFYTAFGGIDLASSAISTRIDNGLLIMNIKPMSKDKKLIGPGYGNAFTVSNPDIKIDKVVDNQDGSYVITYSGKIDAATTLGVAGQDVYTGKLQDAGSSGSIVDKIKAWLESLGLPAWTIWIILLLIILLLALLFRKKKK